MLGFDALAKLPLASLPQDQGASLYPDLYIEPDTFYSATVTPGAVTITPSLYDDPDTFYGPQVNLTIYPALFTDGDTFYSPQVNLTIYPSRYDDPDTFYSPTVVPGTAYLYPDLFVDADAFYAPQINITIRPPLFVDPDTFFPPFVGLGTPPAFFGPSVCMVSGFKMPPGKLARQWNGIWARHDDFDYRHPQELVRPTRDRMGVPIPRPEAEDTFISAGDVTAADL